MVEARIVPVERQVTPELDAYAQAVHSGFLIPQPDETKLALWHLGLLADGAVLQAFYDEDRPFGLAEQPISTFASWRGSLNTGTELVPADLISYVTVQASHRRRGLMKKMMLANLEAARFRGDVFAALTAADTRIYGRFGFGIAASTRRLRIATGEGFGIRTKPVGRCVFAEASAIYELRREIFECFHAEQFLSLSRTALYWQQAVDWDTQELLPERGVVHLDDDGNPDAAATFTVVDGEIRIVDLVGTTPAAEIEIIRMLGEAEGATAILWDRCPDPDHPLRLALTDPRAMKTLAEYDTVWLRIMDVERALRSRSYEADGELVIAVDDPLGWESATYHLLVVQGRATTVERTDADPDIAVTMEGMTPLYSGLQSASGLAAAGFVTGSATGLSEADRVFGRVRRAVVSSDF